jgi:sodium/proline symporter
MYSDESFDKLKMRTKDKTMIMLISFAIYFCILSAVGIYFYHRNKNVSDYSIGNRSLNYWVTAIATQASDMGSWLFLAFPAAIYTSGLFEFWTAIGLVVFMFLNWQFIAPKLRYATEKYNADTISTFFCERYNDRQSLLRIISALITIFFFIFYIAASIAAIGLLFESAFNINYTVGTILGLACGLSYTLIGGFLAVAWCNLFQGLFLLVVILFVPIYAFFFIDGFSAIQLAATAKNVGLSLISSEKSLLSALALAAGWGLGYFGQPHILINFMGIDDPKKISSAKWVGITWQILVLSAAASIGLIGMAFFNTGLANPEMLFVNMTTQLFFPFLAGFVLCAILAATLSTMDSHILVSGSTFAEDLYLQLFNPKASQVKLLKTSRIASFTISAVALYVANHNSSSMYNLVNYAWSGTGSAFGPLMIASLYSNYITRTGALAGMVTGALVSGLWHYSGINILPLVPGFFSSLCVMFGVSSLSKK